MSVFTKEMLHTVLAKELGARRIHPTAIAWLNVIKEVAAPYVDESITEEPIWESVRDQFEQFPGGVFAGAIEEEGGLRLVNTQPAENIRTDIENASPEKGKAMAVLATWVAEFMIAHAA